uniref:Putative disease resistance protein n=1 Tax=Noccaea caerulescens TaxID=107243 RepID=A0A1J3IP80_NOCCA
MNLQKLRVLVIRDSDLLSNIDELCCLRRLNVLEVSGASSLTAISDKFFLELTQLQSLNLSGLGIKFLPSSISQLSNLSCLILRECPVLEDLPDIQNLKKLEVVDIHGARMLKSCFGMKENTSRNRTFCHLQQLQLLDLSESKIRRLPLFHDAAVGDKLRSLTRLSLHNCSNLIRLPNLKPLSGLQILDLSYTTSLVEITEVCFEQKEKLKILNLSGTKITKVPSTISGLSSLSQLLLRDIPNLEALPNIKRLTSLEVFDVSGCTKLHKIEGSFKDMPYLREVNLSETRIETLPELPETSNICCSKLLILADSRRFENDTWSQVKEAVTKEISERLNTSDKVERIHEISGRVDKLWAFPGKKGFRMEHFYKGRIYRDVYMNAISFVDNKSCQQVLEIQGSNGVDQDKETLAKSEFVAFVVSSDASFSSIFSDLKSVKGCWLEMCGDIEILFSGVDEERLRDLETLSITNLQQLKSICSSSSFKNLKKLNLDCCPSILTLFLDASQLPSSLEVLKIKFCENLREVFAEEAELCTHCAFLSCLCYPVSVLRCLIW